LDGDELRGDVEFHLRAGSWHGHGHANDPAYAGVVLHVVATNDSGAPVTHHRAGRIIPLATVSPPGQQVLPAFRPPCSRAAPGAVVEALTALGRRRLQRKAANIRPRLHQHGEGGLLYALLLETLAGPANREAFRVIAERLPLAALLERAESADRVE